MAFAVNTTTNAAILKTTYDSDFALDPTEESVIAGFVAQPVGATKIGNSLVLRKIKALVAGKYSGTSGLPQNLTATTANTEAAVSTTLAYGYAMLELDENAMTRLVDDGNFRNGIRQQLAAAVNSQLDADLFSLSASLTHTESGADINDAMYASALGQLAKYAKGKFKIGETDVRLFVHPDELKNVLVIPAAKEYQIRGSAGTAPSGQLVTTYGIKVAESGNVYSAAGTAYNPLILKDAFALGYNIKPSAMQDQQDGIVTRIIFRAEYGYCLWFDSSGVSLNTTV